MEMILTYKEMTAGEGRELCEASRVMTGSSERSGCEHTLGRPHRIMHRGGKESSPGK